MTQDETWMNIALDAAREAGERGDVPVGAVVIHNGDVIARASNRRLADDDPMAHAELLAIREAARQLGSWRLDDCELYVTLEPCPMCAGALAEARVKRVVFATREPRSGAARSLYQLLDDPRRSHRVELDEGVCEEQARQLLQSFFQSRRS